MRPSETRSYEHAVDAHVRVHALQCPCAMFCHAHGMSPNPPTPPATHRVRSQLVSLPG